LQTELLVQLQRLNDPSPSAPHCLLLAATNCPWDLDAAFNRRFDKRLFVGLPDAESRVELLKRSLAVNRF
jgi:vacuolar protein-sorting-associated protein 4